MNLLNLSCVWILFQNANSHSCFRFLFWDKVEQFIIVWPLFTYLNADLVLTIILEVTKFLILLHCMQCISSTVADNNYNYAQLCAFRKEFKKTYDKRHTTRSWNWPYLTSYQINQLTMLESFLGFSLFVALCLPPCITLLLLLFSFFFHFFFFLFFFFSRTDFVSFLCVVLQNG